MKIFFILTAVIIFCSECFAKFHDEPFQSTNTEHSIQNTDDFKQPATVILDLELNILCIDHTSELAFELNTIHCSDEDLATASSMNKGDIQVAAYTHLAALGGGCLGGATASIMYNRNGPFVKKDEDDVVLALLIGLGPLLAKKSLTSGMASMVTKSYILASATGIVVCTFATHNIIKFFWD